MSIPFHQLIQAEKPVLVDFFATWCGPCKMMAPILTELKAELGDALTIIKIDVDKQAQLAQTFQVQGVPCFLLFKKGEQLWRQSGAMSKAQLKKMVVPHI